MIGVDNCSEVLVKSKKSTHFPRDSIIGDALKLPFRKDIANGVLSVSVLHHFSTLKRRKQAIQQISNIMAPNGRAIIYVWAKEQPYGTFTSQDLLVPWNMHELPLTSNYSFRVVITIYLLRSFPVRKIPQNVHKGAKDHCELYPN
jgi:SAM-dependent methyltransferase